jgi:hypothetical protein
MDWHFCWRGKPKLHPLAVHLQDSDSDGVANDDSFPSLAAKN